MYCVLGERHLRCLGNRWIFNELRDDKGKVQGNPKWSRHFHEQGRHFSSTDLTNSASLSRWLSILSDWACEQSIAVAESLSTIQTFTLIRSGDDDVQLLAASFSSVLQGGVWFSRGRGLRLQSQRTFIFRSELKYAHVSSPHIGCSFGHFHYMIVLNKTFIRIMFIICILCSPLFLYSLTRNLHLNRNGTHEPSWTANIWGYRQITFVYNLNRNKFTMMVIVQSETLNWHKNMGGTLSIGGNSMLLSIGNIYI